MKIATWNVNSLNVRLPHVLAWLEQYQPDILALQELKLDQDKFPLEAIKAAGYHAVWNGQKTYNGVAILSKQIPQNPILDMRDFDDVQKRVIAATVGDVRVICVYCVNGESVGSEKFAYKQRWFAALRQYVAHELQTHANTIVLGDFNIAPHDIDVYDTEKWHEKILCSTTERQWFQALLDCGLHDSLHHCHPEKACYTWWDYRMNMFKRQLGLRIDHILVSAPLLSRLQDVSVATEARGWERPSDHAPVIAQFA
ncbi:exodeoxyribonuclease III [Neisseriaceae bacterium ESL0693]|nr:exodeoxyribonuclease III [Neisseriaceae bacterium ESL0693]